MAETYGIGAVAQRTGVPVRTIRFWSDAGLVPPTATTPSGQRRYDAAAVARVALVATLRQLGLGLDDIRSVLDRRRTVAEVATTHARAIDTELRLLRLRRAVLTAVARRGATLEELTLVNDLARLSAAERQRLVDDFVAETFGDQPDPSGIGARMRELTPVLPDDPTPEQVDAWVELAEMLGDKGFRARVREMADAGRREDGPLSRADGIAFAASVVAEVGPALDAGIDPASPEAGAVVGRVLPDADATRRREIADHIVTFTDLRVDRYWQLLGVLHGWPPRPSPAPAFAWLLEALRVA